MYNIEQIEQSDAHWKVFFFVCVCFLFSFFFLSIEKPLLEQTLIPCLALKINSMIYYRSLDSFYVKYPLNVRKSDDFDKARQRGINNARQ